MDADAVVMMVVAMLVIWGGLALAIANLMRSPDTPRTDELKRDL
jgi:hypothetical protein